MVSELNARPVSLAVTSYHCLDVSLTIDGVDRYASLIYKEHAYLATITVAVMVAM